MRVKLSIIIPVYNEAPVVEEVMTRVTTAPLPEGVEREIIVIDDGSNAATRTALENLRHTFDFQLRLLDQNQGKGHALRKGITVSTGDIVLFQDCDLEYDPADYVRLLTPILEGRSEVVYGSRFLDPGRRPKISFRFRLGNYVLTALSNFFTGLRLTDMETGYKVFDAATLRSIRLAERGFGIEPEVTAKLARLIRRQQLRLVEVPVSYHARAYGEGKKIRPIHGLEAIWCILKYNLSKPEENQPPQARV